MMKKNLCDSCAENKTMNIKTKIKQMFCKHETEACVKRGRFSHLQGNTVYYICSKCGKVVKEEFLTWEEQLERYGKYL